MKNIKNITMLATYLSLELLTVTSFGQTVTKVKSDKATVKKETKIEKTKVPKEVTEVFYTEYPTRDEMGWYGYPSYAYSDDWFYDWYNDAPYVYEEYPEYYVVEYTIDNTPQKNIYTKKGKKVASHKMLKSDVPKAVSAAIAKSAYKDWKLGTEKKVIFKDKESDLMKVYKVYVEKGKEKHALFFQSDGKLLKDKKIS